MFGARIPCQIDDLPSLKFKTHTVSLIQNILMKNLETFCWVIIVKTNQKMTVNLLIMVLIDLPIIKFTCQHHVSGYVCLVWHLKVFFFLLIEIISIAKLLIIVHLFVLKHEKQLLSYIHTKFEGNRNNIFLLQFILWGHPFFLIVFFPTLKITWAWAADAPVITWYELG